MAVTRSPAELVAAWARAAPAPPARRAVALLAATRPDRTPGELAALPLGRRDALLLELRRDLFGDSMPAAADCAGCGERLEVTLGVADLAAAGTPGPPVEASPARFQHGEFTVEFRAPDSGDLAAAAAAGTAAAARAVLLDRCVSAVADGAAVPPADLPGAVVDEVARRMAELDPGADPRVGVQCPACGHGWDAGVDVAAFVWDEVERRVRGLLDDVHVLARAYGWTHDEVLALPPAVRRAYLELAS